MMQLPFFCSKPFTLCPRYLRKGLNQVGDGKKISLFSLEGIASLVYGFGLMTLESLVIGVVLGFMLSFLVSFEFLKIFLGEFFEGETRKFCCRNQPDFYLRLRFLSYSGVFAGFRDHGLVCLHHSNQ